MIEDRLENALLTDQPVQALRSVIEDLSREGQTKPDVYAALEQLLVRLRARQNNSESAQEDIVLEVMDALSGWCHRTAELLPDQRPGG